MKKTQKWLNMTSENFVFFAKDFFWSTILKVMNNCAHKGEVVLANALAELQAGQFSHAR